MKAPLLHIAQQVFDTPLAILPEKLDVILRAVGPRLAVDEEGAKRLAGILHSEGASGLNFSAYWDDDEDAQPSSRQAQKPYKLTSAGVAIVPVTGVLMKKGTWMSALSGCSSYTGIMQAFRCAMDDPAVKGILFDINSPGGSTNGCFELADAIFGGRGTKPLYASSNDLAASAAYAIASACDRIYVTRTGAVGSVGVFSLHCSQSKLDEKVGLDYTYIQYGEKKTDGNEHEALSKSAKTDLQAEVDRQGDIFTSTVARNRGKSFESIRGLQAGVLFGERSIGILADAVGTLDDALADITGKVNKSGVTLNANTHNSTTVATTGGAGMEPQQGSPASAANAAIDVNYLQTVTTPLVGQVTTAYPLGATATISGNCVPGLSLSGVSAATPLTVEGQLLIATIAALRAEMDEMKKERKGKKSDSGDEYAADPKNPDSEPDGDEDCDPNMKDKKGTTMPQQTATTPTATAADPNISAREIAELGKIAGREAAAVDFIAGGKSVADFRAFLLDARSKESSETRVMPSFGAFSADPISAVTQAFAANCKNMEGSDKKKSDIFLATLRRNPQHYKTYNNSRHAAALTPDMAEAYVVASSPVMESFGLTSLHRDATAPDLLGIM